MNKQFFIETFGCQMNEYDSEKICGLLYSQGYLETMDNRDADLIIYNTCLIRENAEKRLYGKLGAIKKLKMDNPSKIIAVCGCIPQNDEIREFILKKFPFIDLIFGTNTYDRLPELLYDIELKNKRVVSILKDSDELKEDLPKNRKFSHKAFVNIMHGCDNYCSYCVVPYTRGREKSRNFHDIVEEVKDLGLNGYKEITLLGQNVNSYLFESDKTYNFADLLRELNEIESIDRIRFISSHPKSVDDDFIKAMKECKKVCNQVHLPIQSGSTKVLKEMNRKYSRENYLEIIRKLKKEIPDVAISSDFIVGFPGETEEDFQETLDLVKEVRFDSAFTFLYSIRPGTPAGRREDQIDEKIKHERFDRLLDVLYPIFEEINISYIGKTVELLVDNVSKNDESYLTGRTDTNKIVHFKGDRNLLGKLVNVKIEKAKTWYMEGTRIE
ncbi:tRNA-i(6)A37 thiotransferase enzyme MiaB [Dethiosulfatibacter aminovorans DSM 17477]|uniref:tRNA-2-methylthio-N(6)-dimethylallyladenosine synthase n=1 Tax=Dethiosulfatibacter aminovorans DSM 17477 TaxID=1121476 RepID=A0A1M6DBI0_9FIRM|nr:tRNA (N6-isopentenyl adenosine(37)-C2)-methylthiotransferase MiaB [Dethiosulfatibacter aminovorans]SHI70563.1 tRNA-i(6)A37 thiotransferase enzyme MiaB [Dethiosulfatibacter aminovorans DSM 17477]